MNDSYCKRTNDEHMIKINGIRGGCQLEDVVIVLRPPCFPFNTVVRTRAPPDCSSHRQTTGKFTSKLQGNSNDVVQVKQGIGHHEHRTMLLCVRDSGMLAVAMVSGLVYEAGVLTDGINLRTGTCRVRRRWEHSDWRYATIMRKYSVPLAFTRLRTVVFDL